MLFVGPATMLSQGESFAQTAKRADTLILLLRYLLGVQCHMLLY